MSDQRTERELLQAILDGQTNMESKFDDVKNEVKSLKKEMNSRFDDVEEQLKKMSRSQDILVKELHESKVEIDLLKNKNQAS